MLTPTAPKRRAHARFSPQVLYAYLTCGNYDFNYGKLHTRSHTCTPIVLNTILCIADRAKNLRPKRNIKTAMAHEARLARLAH